MVLTAAVACGGSGSSGSWERVKCTNSNCTVTLKGTGSQGDLADIDNVEYDYRIVLNKDKKNKSADIRVGRERYGREDAEDEATVKLGKSVTLQGYRVKYVSNSKKVAKFEFKGPK
ncbi:hypothetical protein [Nocardiopsis gilva]|uniref:hypothetical protein n=1 Tax=Nocardiopsis gilva TaxID=280236 RepID=UPI00034DEEBA|nr:hypothetical protein [Nocardiopsis gilva]